MGMTRGAGMIFSVKTGKQRSPAHVRELRGTMKNERAQMGVLVLDSDSTPKMESAAASAGRFNYQLKPDLPPKEYEKVQIVTADEVIDGAKVDCPPTMQAVKRFPESPAGAIHITRLVRQPGVLSVPDSQKKRRKHKIPEARAHRHFPARLPAVKG